jgi:large subunit ribosomal protein L21
MFAVVRSGGKQYKVKKDDVLKLEKIEAEEGAVIILSDVLGVGEEGGKITIGSKAKVAAEVLSQAKDEKKIIFKKKRRHNYRRKRGHRQRVTWVKIQEIGENVQAKAAPAEKKEKKAAAPAPKKEAKPAAEKAAAPKAKKPAAKQEPKGE